MWAVVRADLVDAEVYFGEPEAEAKLDAAVHEIFQRTLDRKPWLWEEATAADVDPLIRAAVDAVKKRVTGHTQAWDSGTATPAASSRGGSDGGGGQQRVSGGGDLKRGAPSTAGSPMDTDTEGAGRQRAPPALAHTHSQTPPAGGHGPAGAARGGTPQRVGSGKPKKAPRTQGAADRGGGP
jgi:hypothetical protein